MLKILLVSFVFVINSVLCCNPEWFYYKQKCYRVINFSYDVRLARRYCQIFRGDLATITDEETLRSAVSFNGYVVNDSYWVNENSTVGETIQSASCSYIYGSENAPSLRVDGECNEGRKFICEVMDDDGDFICPKSWSLYGNTCYKTYKNLATYEQAVSFCSLQQAQLAVLDDIAKEHNAAAVIIGQKEAYLVAVKASTKNETNEYVWSTGKIFQPSCAECRNSTPGDCIGFSSDQQHPTMFTWVNINCSGKNFYMCEMTAQIKSTIQPTTEVSATSHKPLECPVGYNWKSHEASGFCYWETTYESERLNWFQARQFCQSYGGDLATYENSEQEDHGLGGAKGHYRGLWFGLKRGEKDDVFRWVDNTTLSYTNWYTNEPNYKSRTKFCVMHGPRNSEWELDYCGARRWFVCKAPKVAEPKLPNIDLFKKTSCNFSGPSIYKNKWYLYGDYCYLVRDEAKYSWDTAKYFCQDNGGHMASVHSFEETNFILQAMPTHASLPSYWIGLSARGLDSPLTWSDGTPLDFIYWEDDFNNTESVDKCINFEKQKGFWNVEHCNRFLGVVCKRGVNASYEFTTPEPTPTLPGNCESGWYRYGNKCFKPFGEKWSLRSNWPIAGENCQMLDATLVSIHNSEEQDFLTDLVLDIGTSVWTGLQTIDRGTIFKWSDDSPLDYTNWNANENLDSPVSSSSDEDPYTGMRLSSQSRFCVELNNDANSMGKWTNSPCHQQKAYICQKSPNRTLTAPSLNPFECYNMSGWNKLGPACFKVFEESEQELDWVKAQSKCKTFDANLAVFRSTAVHVFLMKRISRKDQFFWIGYRESKLNTYEAITYNPARSTSSNWLPGQPQRVSEIDNCVSMNSKGQWIVKNCKEKHPFICEISQEEGSSSNVEIEKSNFCPTTFSWEDLGGDQCYYFGLGRVSWNKAVFLCHKHGGFLASFHSLKEVMLVKDHLLKSEVEYSFHIGLIKRNDGSYSWFDHTPFDFTFWEDEEPRASSMNCVQMSSKTAKWRPVGCDEMGRNYICSFPKGSTQTTKYPLKEKSHAEDLFTSKTEYKMGVGGILAIITCVTIILAVIGAIVYRLYPISKIRPTLLEPENI